MHVDNVVVLSINGQEEVLVERKAQTWMHCCQPNRHRMNSVEEFFYVHFLLLSLSSIEIEVTVAG